VISVHSEHQKSKEKRKEGSFLQERKRKKGDGRKDFLIESFPMEGHTLCFRKKKSTFVVSSFDTKKECPFKKEKLSLFPMIDTGFEPVTPRASILCSTN
tara:strand:- start:22 stop:318 length:297 start_codon:yes stop_codon:yes gene_type:complete